MLKNGFGKWVKQPMGTCSANLCKDYSDTEVTLTLKPIDKEVTFQLDEQDAGETVEIFELAIGEKVFVLFMALCLVYYMLQISTGYSISSGSVISRVPASPTMTATGFSFTSTKSTRRMTRKIISEWYVSFSFLV